MNEQNPFDVFTKEAPEVAKGFDSLIQSLIATRGLDAKTKQLIYIGIKAANYPADHNASFNSLKSIKRLIKLTIQMI